jgi:hypothetical protein
LTKPVRRYELLCGKLLGIVILDAVLLFAFAAIIYGLTMFVPNLTKASEEDIMQAQNEFFTARATIKPQMPDLTKEIDEAYNKLSQQGQLPQQITASQVRQQLEQQMQLARQAAPVGSQLRWQFDDIGPIDPNGYVFIRFKYDVSVNPPDLQIYGRWYVGDIRQIGQGPGATKTPIYVVERKDSIRTIHEFAVPANAIVDGYLGVIFENVPLNNTLVIFSIEDGLEILYKADSFGANFIRATLLIFARLVFLAAVGISVSTWLSFPVAILVCLVVFFSATISGFIVESFDILGGNLGVFYQLTVQPLLNLLPQFDKLSPSEFMINGKLLSWWVLARAAAIMVLIQAMVVWIAGIIIFSFKELARITV